MSVPKSLLEAGTVLENKWVILEFVGRGGMGEVYRAHQLNLKRDVAIKIISQEWLSSLNGEAEEIESALERFRREVQAMAQVRHPNVVQIYDYGSTTIRKGDEDIFVEYIAMEYIRGATLRFTMSDEGFSPDEDAIKTWLVNYFLPVLDGVQAVHEVGIAHRDLKPANVLLDGTTPKIADFGLARACNLKPVTRSMHILGSPPYMSPEQFTDLKRTDTRADIYSLGKILCEAIEGKFGSETIPFKSASLSQADTPFLQGLDMIIRQATAEERSQRIASVNPLKKTILDVLEETGKVHRPVESASPRRFRIARRWLIAVGLSIVVLGVVVYYAYQRGKSSAPRSALRPSFTEPAQRPIIQTPQQPNTTEAPAPNQGLTPSSIRAKDGTTLRLIPGGDFTFPENFAEMAGTSVKVESFYLDENEVTNQQYVDFLNQVLTRLRVDNDTVRFNGEIWLLLGEALEGYEPIVFRDGKFIVYDPSFTAHPVVRVTPHGAAAYTRFYGLRLPTEVEWLHAVRLETESQETAPARKKGHSQGWMEMGEMHEQMIQPSQKASQHASKLPSPVVVFEPNAYGVRGLRGNVSEWGIWTNSERRKSSKYVILAGLGDESKIIPALNRQPWEAFEEVGFRCAMSVASQSQ